MESLFYLMQYHAANKKNPPDSRNRNPADCRFICLKGVVLNNRNRNEIVDEILHDYRNIGCIQNIIPLTVCIGKLCVI